MSLELIERLDVGRSEPVVDVGGGTSALAGRLLGRGFSDVTVLDLSASALTSARTSLGALADRVAWLEQDVLDWSPPRRYGLWHDRAVFHFLLDPSDRRQYVARLREALLPHGALVIGTFAPDGPDRCSGLPVARYSASELIAALGEGFTLVAARREEHRTPRGTIQPFTWVALRSGG
jgi:trans-aconitate methyltransferase